MIPPQVAAESELLLLCARTQLDNQQTDRLRKLIQQELNWEYFYNVARRHSLVPLVYRRLELAAKEADCPEVLRQFRKGYRENAARNLILTRELVSLIRDLKQIGIEAVPFKGPALALAAYKDSSLRRYIDLDLIVRRRDITRARDLLITRGYSAGKNWDQRQESVLLNAQHNIQFSRDDGQFIVELHWRVATQLFAASLNAEDFWPNLKTMALENITVKTLSTEDLLFSLCVHGSRHLWERLSWICDVAELISVSPEIEWEPFLQRAQETETERMLLLGLHLAASVGGVSLPSHIATMIAADRAVLRLADRIVQRLLNGIEHVPATKREIFRFNLAVRRRWNSRLRYCLYALGPSDSDVQVFSVPRFLNFAYYLIRPFRLVGQQRPGKSIGSDWSSKT